MRVWFGFVAIVTGKSPSSFNVMMREGSPVLRQGRKRRENKFSQCESKGGIKI